MVVVFGRSILTVDFSCWVFGFGSQLLFFWVVVFCLFDSLVRWLLVLTAVLS